jgi:hypothetical protein
LEYSIVFTPTIEEGHCWEISKYHGEKGTSEELAWGPPEPGYVPPVFDPVEGAKKPLDGCVLPPESGWKLPSYPDGTRQLLEQSPGLPNVHVRQVEQIMLRLSAGVEENGSRVIIFSNLAAEETLRITVDPETEQVGTLVEKVSAAMAVPCESVEILGAGGRRLREASREATLANLWGTFVDQAVTPLPSDALEAWSFPDQQQQQNDDKLGNRPAHNNHDDAMAPIPSDMAPMKSKKSVTDRGASKKMNPSRMEIRRNEDAEKAPADIERRKSADQSPRNVSLSHGYSS